MVSLDIKKITGEYTIHQEIKELDHHYPDTIKVSDDGGTPFTPRVSKIMSSPFFRRLASVSQLGFIAQIYPSASHSRFEHVLGTYANVARYCDALWNDPVNPFFKQVITEHEINIILLTALFHDVGQYPLAHDIEEAEKELFSHKNLAKELLLDHSFKETELNKVLIDEWEVEPAEIIDILETKTQDYGKSLKSRLLHSIIDGPIDADKLDYLQRDSKHLDLPYGQCFDFSRLLKCLTVFYKKETVQNAFISIGINEKGRIPAEAVAFARYSMFGAVYWHHTSRSAKSMLHRAVWEALHNNIEKGQNPDALKKSFLEKIKMQIGSSKSTPELPGLSKLELTESPQLTLSDYEMLVWLSTETNSKGFTLLKMLCERDLFKRLRVLSHRKEPELWDKLIRLRNADPYTWREWMGFQNIVQMSLIESLESLAPPDIVQKIQKMGSQQILFLVDIPSERKGSSVDLYFIPEKRMHGPVSSEQITGMEDSIVWSNLSIDFLKSVGKIRVYCHPAIIEDCTTYFGGTTEIEGALRVAYQKICG